MLHVQPQLPFPSIPDDEDDGEQTEFSFAELSDRAKERAREKWRESAMDYSWWGSTYEDADTIAGLLGIDIPRKNCPTVGGGTSTEPAIWFTGFWSQGDGACLEGTWSPPDHDIAAKVREYAPQDEKLHEIADRFAAIVKRCAHRNVTARSTHTDRYYHAYSTTICVDIEPRDELAGREVFCEALDRAHNIDGIESELAEAMRSFMNWIYRQLEAEYEYQTSDERADEDLADDGKLYDENGNEID